LSDTKAGLTGRLRGDRHIVLDSARSNHNARSVNRAIARETLQSARILDELLLLCAHALRHLAKLGHLLDRLVNRDAIWNLLGDPVDIAHREAKSAANISQN